MKDNRKIQTFKVIIIILLCYFMYDYPYKNHFSNIRDWINLLINDKTVSGIITYSLLVLPLIIGTAIIHKFKNIHQAVGLNKSLLQGLTVAFVGTLPMLIGFVFLFKFNDNLSIRWLIWGSIVAGFFEEFIFRGILFGQIFRYTKIGFIPTIVIGATLFALGHLYQSQDLGTIIGIFLTTFLGSILFAWLFAEWNYNLWVPIFLHLFMNLYWILFAVSDNAFGSLAANICRVTSIICIITLTLVYKRKRNLRLEINRKSILLKQ